MSRKAKCIQQADVEYTLACRSSILGEVGSQVGGA